MKFELKIELENDAMRTPFDVAATLRLVARNLPDATFGRFTLGDYGTLRDVNGNTVGRWELVE
jgi:hypothetical protein